MFAFNLLNDGLNNFVLMMSIIFFCEILTSVGLVWIMSGSKKTLKEPAETEVNYGDFNPNLHSEH